MIRNDFVSNSSSSSFIMISNKIGDLVDYSYLNDKQTGKYVVPNTERGKHEFGWEHETTDDFFGKLNFCALQCYYSSEYGERWFKMLHDIVHQNFKLDIELAPLEHYGDHGQFTSPPHGMYIDHQSCASEGACTEMFDNQDNLLNFLSNNYSYIEGGNDNGGDKYYD